MDGILKFFGAVFLGLVMVFIAAVLGGTILWLIWPVAIPAVFPKVVEQGVLAAKLTWWQAVLFTWVATILFKASTTTSKEK